MKSSEMNLFVLLYCISVVFCETYYDLLGVSKNADTREIRKAFKQLALKLHPDKNKDAKDAHEKFIEINKAYEVLKDDEMRKKYDLHGEEGLKEDFGKSWTGNYHSWNYYYESFGIYDDDPEIITLSRSDFVQSVLDSSDVWFVNFYSPQCSHCHDLAPAWRELARELEGVIRVGAVNCEEDWMLCRQQSIQAYPSLMIYPKHEKYAGSREAEAMIDYVLQQLPNNVIELTAHKFDDLILAEKYQNLPWLVFTCTKSLDCASSDVLKRLGILFERLVNVAEVDARNNKKICSFINCNHLITFYPKLSKETKSEQGYVVINGTEPKEISKQILQLLPETKTLTDEELKDIGKKLKNATEFPWLIQFIKNAEITLESGAELKRLAALLPGVRLGRFNCEQHPQECTSFYIQKYPTFVVFKNEGGYEIHHGRITAHDIARFTNQALSSNLRTLVPQDFPDILQSDEDWFIDFFAPWCPPCMQLLPEWRKAAQMGGNLVHFGSLDCTVHVTVCRKYNVRSYPTMILYRKGVPNSYHGSHSRSEIVDFITDILNPLVISLDPSLFKDQVEKKSEKSIWVVDYFAPWCGPCQQLAPQWRLLAKKLKAMETIHVGQVDCQEHHSLCSTMGINSYPTIRLYPTGTTHQFYTYNGWSRDADSLQAWIYNYLPSDVKSLSDYDFKSKVLPDSMPWVVDFYAPWCHHCQIFAPEFEKIAQVLKGKVNAGKLNCEQLPHVCRQASVRAYPTVVFYEGSRSGETQNPISEEIHTLTLSGIMSFIESRLNIKLQKPSLRDEL